MHPIVTRVWRRRPCTNTAPVRPHAEIVTPDQGSSFRCLPRLVVRYGLNLHHHGVVELHALSRGAGTAVVGDRVLPWRAPAAFLIGPGIVHTWASDPRLVPPPHTSLVLQWPPDLAERLADVPEAGQALAVQRCAARGLLLTGQAAEAVALLLDGWSGRPGHERLGRWLAALAAFARARPLASPRAPLGVEAGERLERVIAWVDQHLAEPLSLAGAARVAGMHPQAIARFFRRHTGLSLIGYVQQQRIGRACALLLEPGSRIGVTAHAAGFNGLAHFNRVFRRTQGCTPQAWRAAVLGQQSAS